MSLLQNQATGDAAQAKFDYQSECHCSKTRDMDEDRRVLFDYQSECHCSKTVVLAFGAGRLFDYQSECHCSKTNPATIPPMAGLTTSQNVTAPKPIPCQMRP